MAKLSTAARKHLPKSSFAIPSKAPAHGSFPIPNRSHAINALSRAAAKGGSTEAKVRAAVHRKYPDLGKGAAHGRGSGPIPPHGSSGHGKADGHYLNVSSGGPSFGGEGDAHGDGIEPQGRASLRASHPDHHYMNRHKG